MEGKNNPLQFVVNNELLKKEAPLKIKELQDLQSLLLETQDLRNTINTLIENRIGEPGTTIEIEHLRQKLSGKEAQFNQSFTVPAGVDNLEAISNEIKRWQNILEN
jgi:regulator of replication initiation timing